MRLFIYPFLIIVIASLVSCNQSTTPKQEPIAERDTTISAENSYTQLFFDSTLLENFILDEKIHDTMAVRLRNFYNQRNYQFAWFFKDGIADYATTFINTQNDYMGYSLDSSIYNPILQSLVDSATLDTSRIAAPLRLKTELMLTRQFFRYSSHAYGGRTDINTKDLGWFIPRKKLDVVQVLDSMLANKRNNLSVYEPVNSQYKLLKDYLVKYYQIEKDGGWTPVNTVKKTFKNGDTSAAIKQAKQRLWLTGDLQANDSTNLLTDEMETALKKYQQRYGIKADGKLNTSVIKEMNRPVSERIRQILVNMERIRWIPAEPATDFLFVNIPAFKLYVYENGQFQWDMNVVVGTNAHSTVIFNGDMKYVVFSPYWYVPPGILRNEVKPGMARNKNYLANHNMEWNGGAVRQKPGPKNSLGLVKFLFPNTYNIYLHDTPSKSLFNESSRAFSHGCIRLAEPKKLAIYLLRNDSTWNEKSITKAMNAGKEKYVTLKKPVPVFIGYFTAWVDRDGQLNFRDDIYGHDKKMAERLFR